MALTAAQRFDILVPDFATHPSKDGYLEMAEEQTAPAGCGSWDENRRAQAVALRAAHQMTLALDPLRAGGVGGPISSKREGDLQVAFGGGSSSTRALDDLEQTAFGIQLRALIRGTFTLLSVTEPHTEC